MMLLPAIVAVVLAQPVTEEVPVEAALQAAADAYRAAPTAERITLTVREGPRERTESFVVRLDPAKPGSSRVGSLALEFGKFQAWMGGGQLVVRETGVDDALVVRQVEARSASEALEDVLPPLVLPGLAALGGGLERGDLGPLVPPLVWVWAEVESGAGHDTVTINGTCDAGPEEVVLDAKTGRIASFSVPIAGSDAWLEASCRPVDPGDPASWRIETQGLAKVASLRELLTPPAPIAVGDVLSAFPVEDGTGEPWFVDSLFAGSGAPEYAALLVYRAGCDAGVLDATGTTLTKLEQELTRPGGTMLPAQVRRMTWRPVVVGKPGDEDRSRFGERKLLIAWSPARTIDRFGLDAQAVIVVVGGDRRVAAIIDAGDTAGIERTIRALMPKPANQHGDE